MVSDRPYFVDLVVRKVLSEDVTFQEKPNRRKNIVCEYLGEECSE